MLSTVSSGHQREGEVGAEPRMRASASQSSDHRRSRCPRAQGTLHPVGTDHRAAAEPPAEQGNLKLETHSHCDLGRFILFITGRNWSL